MTVREQIKQILTLQAWANYWAEQEGTSTIDNAIKWKRSPEFRKELTAKYERIAKENTHAVMTASLKGYEFK